MPQKKPFTKLNKQHLKEIGSEGFSELLSVRSVINGYYKKSDDIYKDLDAIIRFYRKWKEDLENDLTVKS